MQVSTRDWLLELSAMPVAPYLSDNAWNILRAYVDGGPTAQRGHRLVEFFKALDWLPYDDIAPNPLQQLSSTEQTVIRSHIDAYFRAKASKREVARTQREDYRLRVFAHFRAHVSAEDKRMLEDLRDYELERTGEDVNWRHYFWFSSFKQIDDFIAQDAGERRELIVRFKTDVEQRCKNAQRIREGTYANHYWGETIPDSTWESLEAWLQEKKTQPRNPSQKAAAPNVFISPEIRQACRVMALPPTATEAEIRQRFRELALQHHPDRPGGDGEKMKLVLAAYEQLKRGFALHSAR